MLIRDACCRADPDLIQQAVIYDVERLLGWTATINDMATACAIERAA
ncbi:hypothetical protein ACVMIH_002421 [Bradyrhizobium sp. USDA 4503]